MTVLGELPIWQPSDEYKQLSPQIAAILLYGLDLARNSLDDADTDSTAAALDAAESAIIESIELPESGGIMSYVRVTHQLPVGTGGGTALAGSWRTRTLNTLDTDTDSIASLSSSQIALPPGTYRIESTSHHSNSYGTSTRVRRLSDSAILCQSVNINIALSTTGNSTMSDQFTLESADEIILEYRVGNSLANTGLGNPLNFSQDELYAVLELWKIS